jgi:hypothetical protein
MARLNRFAVEYGTFDEKRIGRDRTPDRSTGALAKGVILYMILRTGGCFFLHYDKSISPLDGFTASFPLRLAAWELVMDGFFYIYHRACHEGEIYLEFALDVLRSLMLVSSFSPCFMAHSSASSLDKASHSNPRHLGWRLSRSDRDCHSTPPRLPHHSNVVRRTILDTVLHYIRGDAWTFRN